MLMVSREVPVKIGKHSWNVFPLEAFGYLLGTLDGQQLLVALPCSKTARWHGFSDRWDGIKENLDTAKRTAANFGLHVIGFYCSTEQMPMHEYPVPECLGEIPIGFLLTYQNVCCPQCSWFSIFHQGINLVRGEGYMLSKGKRSDRNLNQRRVHQAWISVFGSVDYSNGHQDSDRVAQPIIPPDLAHKAAQGR